MEWTAKMDWMVRRVLMGKILPSQVQLVLRERLALLVLKVRKVTLEIKGLKVFRAKLVLLERKVSRVLLAELLVGVVIGPLQPHIY